LTHPNPSTALASAVVDELASCGVSLVVISPGSRSAALAIAAAAHPDLGTRVVIDERSAAFHALGHARATGRPAAVVATSGTAPANFFPAVVEADASCVPIIAISADRPEELHGVGANQTIDQVELFGNKVRSYAGIDAPSGDVDGNCEWRESVRRLLGMATGPRPGPVHLNVAFREPTVPIGDDGRTVSPSYPFDTPRLPTDEGTVAGPVGEVAEHAELHGDRGLVIAGDGHYSRDRLLEAARALGWPVLATALSSMRGEAVVSAYHRVLGRAIPAELRPDVVVAVGAIGPDPVLEDLIAVAATRIRVDAWGRHIDPRRNASHVLTADPVRLVESQGNSASREWLRKWLQANGSARQAMSEVILGSPAMTGAAVALSLNQIDWDALVVASSLPIREVDAHLTRSGEVFANRGASGIDGFVSTALGVAASRPRTIALAGDLSFLHDGNGFLHDAQIDLTMVVIDNKGGGLFDSLPTAVHASGYERLFVTDPKRDIGALAAFHGARVHTVDEASLLVALANTSLERAGVDVIVVPVDRAHDLEMRSQLAR